MKRGMGQTTTQILHAPKNAYYVWVNGAVHYPKDLARHLGRTDIQVLSPRDLDDYCRIAPTRPVVVDHAAPLMLNDKQREILNILIARFESRQRSRS
jgi:hypothetical protein